MEKSKIQEALETTYSKPESDQLNPDNHNKVIIRDKDRYKNL